VLPPCTYVYPVGLGGGIVAEMREIPDGDLDLALQEERNRTKWISCLGSMDIEFADRRNARC
jgi:hypothetical protein